MKHPTHTTNDTDTPIPCSLCDEEIEPGEEYLELYDSDICLDCLAEHGLEWLKEWAS